MIPQGSTKQVPDKIQQAVKRLLELGSEMETKKGYGELTVIVKFENGIAQFADSTLRVIDK